MPDTSKTFKSHGNPINVHILGQKGLDARHLEETAKWFERHPGPTNVIVDHRPVSLDLNHAGALSLTTPLEKLSVTIQVKKSSQGEKKRLVLWQL